MNLDTQKIQEFMARHVGLKTYCEQQRDECEKTLANLDSMIVAEQNNCKSITRQLESHDAKNKIKLEEQSRLSYEIQ
jgi:hypothetical protein